MSIFYDAFGEQAEFLIASLNFSDHMSQLQGGQSKLEEILDKLWLDLSRNPHSEKTKSTGENILSIWNIWSSKAEERLDWKIWEEDIVLAGSLFVYMPQKRLISL